MVKKENKNDAIQVLSLCPRKFFMNDTFIQWTFFEEFLFCAVAVHSILLSSMVARNYMWLCRFKLKLI